MKNRVMLIAAMAVFGTIGLFVRNISVSSGELALYRAVLAALMIGAFLLITRQKIPFADIKKEILLLLVSGIAMGFNWIFLFEAYKYTTVSAATLSYYFAPVLVAVASPILFREKLTVGQWGCFGVSTFGIVLLTLTGDMGSGSNHILGIGLGLVAACLYAAVILLNKMIKGVEGIHRTFLQFISAIIVLLPYVALTGGFTVLEMRGSGWLFLLLVGLVHTGIAYCMYFSALKELPGQSVAILSYIDPLVAVLISVAVLHEAMSELQVIGGLLVLGSTLWNELHSIKKH